MFYESPGLRHGNDVSHIHVSLPYLVVSQRMLEADQVAAQLILTKSLLHDKLTVLC
jgi:hypothetical protein